MALVCKPSVWQAVTAGDYVWCKYTALTANTYGIFKELGVGYSDGSVTGLTLPSSPSQTPNGYFKFILVGYDRLGNKKFIADRNIQCGISWDTLNTAGVASGSGVPTTIDGKSDEYVIRLVTGGINSTDVDNEWTKIIVESNLGGTITAGDTNTWFPSGAWSWTSTSYDASNRVVRGYSGISGFSYGVTSALSVASTGFRPILIVTEPSIYATPIKVTPTHVYTNTSPVKITALIEDFDALSNVQATLSINGDEKQIGVPITDQNVCLSVDYNDLASGDNTVTIRLAAGVLSGSFSVQIFKEAYQRTSVKRTFISLDGGYTQENISFVESAKIRSKYKQQPYLSSSSGRVFGVELDRYTNKVEI